MTVAFPPIRRPLVEVEHLSVAFGTSPPAVRDVSFSIAPGECVALVGESGSGKSVTARSLIGLAGAGAATRASRLRFDGRNLSELRASEWQRLRGGSIGFVLQDALGSLDPLRSVGDEIGEALWRHGMTDRAEREARILDLLREVGIPDPDLRARQLPGALSGGLRQRALIASAIACGPKLLIADEPTTALDASIQAQIIELLDRLRGQGTALLLISHDLGVVARLADRIAVMKDGEIVEQASARAILNDPRHDYTRRLVDAARTIHGGYRPRPRVAPPGGTLPVAAVENVTKTFPGPDGTARRVVEDVSLRIDEGETVGLVGESGSGKTTVSRILLGLERPDLGTIALDGIEWRSRPAAEQRRLRRSMQPVFQDPLASFDPRYTVWRVLEEAIRIDPAVPRSARRARATELLEQVRLAPALLDRRPIELSGGQRQRIAIARAVATRPRLLVCDEPVSALDVSVQADILKLLEDLKAELGMACLFISHDLGVVRRLSDRIVVMKDGRIVEQGAADAIFTAPAHAYTRSLLAAIPAIEVKERVTAHA